MKYLAILGQNPQLSLAEFFAVYPKIKIIARSDEAVVFESQQKIDIGRLGGIPKLAEIIKGNNPQEVILSELSKLPKDKKIFFGLSFYNTIGCQAPDSGRINNNLGKNIKKALKEKSYKVRWVTSRDLELSSVVVKTNKLLRRGGDFCIFFSRHSQSEVPVFTGINSNGNPKIYIAKTIAIQDFSDYEFRDIKRPARDLLSGMTPPKLAKVLINLGKKHQTILDPFCGSGTFLGEAALLGFKNIYSSDVSEKAVYDSKKNLEWLKENYKFKADVKIKKCDIKNIAKCWDRKFNFIATEPYLGPPIRGTLSQEKITQLKKELEENYEEYLRGLSFILEKNGILVLIVPIILSVRIAVRIKENGFEIINPLPKDIYDKPTIIYSRQGQKIGREIYILKKL